MKNGLWHDALEKVGTKGMTSVTECQLGCIKNVNPGILFNVYNLMRKLHVSFISCPGFASHRHRRRRPTASCPGPFRRRRRRWLPESTLTRLIRPWRSWHASSSCRTRSIIPHRYWSIFSYWRCAPTLACAPVDSIRNIVFFVQRVCAFPARGYLLAMPFAEIVGCSCGAACVGESDRGRIVPKLRGGVEGGLFLGEGGTLGWCRRLVR